VKTYKKGVRMYALTQYGLAEFWHMLNYVPLIFIPQIVYILSNLTIDKRLGKIITLVFF